MLSLNESTGIVSEHVNKIYCIAVHIILIPYLVI